MKPRRPLLAATIVLAVALVAALIAFGPRAVRKPDDEPAQPPGISQIAPDRLRYPAGAPQLARLKIQPVSESIEPTLEPLNARISYDENRTVRLSVPISGRVRRILAQPGDSVQAGQPLAAVDAPDYANALAEQRKAQADFDLKRKAHERARMLHDAGVIARKELEAADSDLRQAQAEAARTAARLKTLGDSARDDGYVVRAPVAGVVAERNLNPGEELRPDLPDPLFVITDPKSLWLVLELPERDLGKLAQGQPLAVETDAYPDVEFAARVASIGVTLDPQSRRVPVRAVIDNADLKLKPGMYARATALSPQGRRAIPLPNSALLTSGLYDYVFVETEPGVLQKRRVEVSVRGHDQSYVSAGLAAGERVVTSGVLLLDSELASGG